MNLRKGTSLILAVGLAAMAAAETPPRWAIGVFSGYNGFIKRDIQVEVRQDGQARFSSREAGNEVRRVTGTYSRSMLRFGRTEYSLEQWENGIRLTNWNNRDDWAQIRPGAAKWAYDSRDDFNNDRRREDDRWRTDDRRVDDWRNDPWRPDRRDNILVAEQPPSWAVGIFRDRRNGSGIEFRVSPRGQVFRVIGRSSDQGVYRSSKFYIGNTSYSIQRLGNGMLLRTDQRRGETMSLERIVDRNWSGSEGAWDRPGDDRPFRVEDRSRDDRPIRIEDRPIRVENRDAQRVTVALTSPGSNALVRSREVWFRGRTDADQVRIEVFRSGRSVSQQTVRVSGGSFNSRVNLDDGSYTARIRPMVDGRVGTEKSVSFRVQR